MTHYYVSFAYIKPTSHMNGIGSIEIDLNNDGILTISNIEEMHNIIEKSDSDFTHVVVINIIELSR